MRALVAENKGKNENHQETIEKDHTGRKAKAP
jgi:hypothetical protein